MSVKMILVAATLLAASPTLAQTSGENPTPGKTCTVHWQECVAFNKNINAPTARCDGYRDACMKEGRWKDRNRHFFPVQQK